MKKGTKNILILDTTHGAEILAQRMAGKGYRIVCVDIYKKTTEDTINAMINAGAIFEREVPPGAYDVVINPSHCTDSFLKDVTWKERMTFSQAVGTLIEDKGFRIEVTGVKGKTSTCFLIAHVLSTNGMSVFLHNSRAYGPWENGKHHELGKMSINPASILRMPADEYDVTISEVSLGGSGKADIALITNIAEDYLIAAKTRKASDAKADILTEKVNIVPNEEIKFWEKYGKKVRGYGGRVRILDTPDIDRTEIEIDYQGSHKITMGGGYLAIQYLDSVEAALEVFDAMNIPFVSVIKGLESFKGVPGRGEIIREDDTIIIKERNPGISHISVEYTLNSIRRSGYDGKILAILDPVNKKVCDALDIDKIREVVDRYYAKLIFAGEPHERCEMTAEFIKEGFQ